MLFEVVPEHLMPQMENIVEYMLQSSQDENHRVALEACDFWIATVDIEESHPNVAAVLPRFALSLFLVLFFFLPFQLIRLFFRLFFF